MGHCFVIKSVLFLAIRGPSIHGSLTEQRARRLIGNRGCIEESIFTLGRFCTMYEVFK